VRYPTGRNIVLSHTFYDDETPVTPASVSYAVTDADGTEVDTGSATPDGDAFTATVDAQDEGVYTVTWSATNYTDVTTFEVVGGFIFDLPELRALDPDLTIAKFPTARAKQIRERVEAEFERIVGRSFTPRTKTIETTYDGTGSVWLQVFDVRSVVSVKVDGDAATDLTEFPLDASGFLTVPETFTSASGSGSVADDAALSVRVAYGFPAVPDDVKGAALLRARGLLASDVSAIPDRATSFVADNGGQFVLATAGLRGWETGVPEVDAVIKRYRYDVLHSAVTIGF
jgi:hypothetical protein